MRLLPLRNIRLDIQNGVGDVVVMEKYQITPSELKAAKTNMIDLKVGDPRTAPPGQTKGKERRTITRFVPLYNIPIYDANNPNTCGTINDISSSGVQVAGVAARVHEIRTFIIKDEPFFINATLAFTAQCRWTGGPSNNNPVAGFEITEISLSHSKELSNLITALTCE
jgi:hypothetical protein